MRPRKHAGSNRLRRIISLICLLDAGEPLSSAELADEIGVSKRTIYRDLAALKEAGVPAVFDDRESGYSLAAPVICRLKVNELLCALIAMHAVQLRASPEFSRLLRRAQSKLARILPDSAQKVPEALDRIFGQPPRGSSRKQEDYLLAMLRAVMNNRSLLVNYDAEAAGPQSGKLQIAGLKVSEIRWEVIGKFEGARHYRAIALDRLQSVRISR